MYKVKLLIFTIVALSLLIIEPSISFAQNNTVKRSEMETVNMSRAFEALENGDTEEMLKYLGYEIKSNPQNGYAYAWAAYVYQYYDDFANVLYHSDKALKYIPSKDKEYVSFTYYTRARCYEDMEQYDKALGDYNKAISISPKMSDLYEDRAELYYKLGQYDLSDNDYMKITELDESKVIGYMGIGRNAKVQGKYAEAIKIFDYVIKVFQSYSSAYSFRAECYMRLGKFDEAADDIVKALVIDDDDKAYFLMRELADSSYITIISRLKVQHNKEPNVSSWLYYMGNVSETAEKYDKAIEYYKECYSIDANTHFLECISSCLSDMGDYEESLSYLERAISQDTTDIENFMDRAELKYALGDIHAAIKDVSYCIQQYPEYFWFYYRRGWYNDIDNNLENALEDYTTSITLKPDYAYNYMIRGRLYLKIGEKAAARKDLQKAIELDTVGRSHDAAMFAYFYLGEPEKALQFIDTLISLGEYYNVACLYSLMNKKDSALFYIEKTLDNGYRNFFHIEKDSDFDNIRELPEFKNLVAKYKEEVKKIIVKNKETLGNYEEKVIEIPFERKNGVTEVKCSINGLPLYFVFDTGASDITISMVEASFMLKNGYLNQRDIIGKQTYLNANGEISEGTVINLGNVEIGELNLTNVRASVVKSQNAPLLLGQSALQRLGKIEIDNSKRVLRITYMDEK